MCERWKIFDNFLADMGCRPPSMTLDRWPNKDGNYEPGNCRWATRKQQGRNTTRNRILIVRGITGCLEELAEYFGIDSGIAASRLQYGWDVESAFTMPVKAPDHDALGRFVKAQGRI